MPLSPKTDSMMQQPGQDQEQQIFEQSFSDMAQSMLMNKFPELAQDVATFKIIDSDMDTGSAVGAFIVQRPQNTIYVPVVLVENQLKPLEIMYSQEHDVFLPLSPEWLGEIERGVLENLGDAAKTPETLYSDVDIRNLIVPPTTGRYSFASFEPEDAEKWIGKKSKETGKWIGKAGKDAGKWADKAGKDAKKAVLKLPDALRKAEDKVKKKFAAVLESDPSLLKVAVAIYGAKNLTDALQVRTEKTAADAPTATEKLDIVNHETDSKTVKSLFGPQAPEAMRGIAIKGYFSKDTRKNLNRPVDEESKVQLQQISASGAYKLYKKRGGTVTAYVTTSPIQGAEPEFKYDRNAGATHASHSRVGILTSDGAFFVANKKIYGEPIQLGELDGTVAKALKGEGAVKSGKGVFVRNRAGKIEFTEPLEIKSVTTDKEGVKRAIAEMGWKKVVIVIDEKAPHGRAVAPKGSGLILIPPDFKWVPVGFPDDEAFSSHYDDVFVTDPMQVSSSYMKQLRQAGAEPVAVKKAGVDDYVISGTGFSGSRIDTVIKVASDYRVSINDAEAVLGMADDRGVARVLITSPLALAKFAAEDSKPKAQKPPTRKTTVEEPMDGGGGEPPPEEEMPPEEGEMPPEEGDPSMDPSMDPAAQGMDPAAMAPPSPTDQAVAELSEEVQRAHEEQMKLLQHKIDALQMVQMRTQEIVQGVPKEQSQAIQQAITTAAAGMPQAGAPAPAGAPGAAPQPGMDPSQGGQPGMDPSQGGQPGMDPGMVDPAAQGPMDPSNMQQAAGMQDPSMFDAAAIGSLAEHTSLKELIGNYMPTLEKSVDHVGRILLTLWIKGAEMRKQMGEQNYSNLEDKLKNLFRGMGEVVLRLNRDSLVLPDGEGQDGHEAAGM